MLTWVLFITFVNMKDGRSEIWKYSEIYGIEVLGIIMDRKPVDLYYPYDYETMTAEHDRVLQLKWIPRLKKSVWIFSKLTWSPGGTNSDFLWAELNPWSWCLHLDNLV